ncbi:transposase [Parachlamydia sp. AcF125]|uniref:transposase n=1 Tax=Parachlamydia sp. AcF125 TaxID=2795736 RepID=UPI001BCA28D7|nr:transposase [Parachlamydia sp. AcF125]MBS4168126.1 hypothetical protein [Parachlamydia sp. AcF125]
MKDRLFPLSEKFFKDHVMPLIHSHHKRPGRPPKHGYYLFFCAILYVLRTGISWRDIPVCFGHWHTVYMQFKRWSENGLFWSILYQLQQKKQVQLEIVWVDSTNINVHRHGGGAIKKKVNSP